MSAVKVDSLKTEYKNNVSFKMKSGSETSTEENPEKIALSSALSNENDAIITISTEGWSFKASEVEQFVKLVKQFVKRSAE